MTLTTEIPDTILLMEFGPANRSLELVLQETKPGPPAEIRKHLEALSIRDGLFVYVASTGEIVTADEYLQKEPA